MLTEILMPTKSNIELCAKAIKSGGTVAFPTETVYGLGASIYSADAVKRIFEIKGRPNDNPLIVHIAKKEQLAELAKKVPPIANKLIDAFMPGALTLVFEKKDGVPDSVTGGLGTVAVRMPSNPVAAELLLKCGVPVCAPSANTSGLPSATRAKHVLDDFNGKIPYILDGGICKIGVESTVLDVTQKKPRILRIGGVTQEEIEKIAGKTEIYFGGDKALSPGMKYKHYSPKAEVYFSTFYEGMEKNIHALYSQLKESGKNPVVLSLDGNLNLYENLNTVKMGKTNADYAKNLFSALRNADEKGFKAVIAEGVEGSGIGAAIINRLVKSSGGRIF